MLGPIPSPTGDNRDWEAESDALTLATADEIMADPIRLNKAKTAAQGMATEKLEQVKNLLTVSGHTFNQTFDGFEVS